MYMLDGTGGRGQRERKVQLSHFDLNLLRALDILLTERNVTHAAERLFITQQAASSALQRLRRYFDDEFSRVSAGIWN
ncbi:LysR family transcriptional regulator [Sphingobium fuliginis]|jgi:hypothetical protein|uniref:LysR family transcriptional regulator n=1 Tax=Sphingobium fuliginis (strain ATCC 27551) TaxID=336203 RepID=A0A7M2GMX6_SPHSA|nr:MULTISPECIES: LysR family transcriptional regulator [Sphingobium]QOT74124.1 LysR family transcriptional regulator [Sphingobium fuliginis]